MSPEYLGDGLYVEDQGHQLRIYASNGVDVLEVVYMDDHVLAAFLRYVERRAAARASKK